MAAHSKTISEKDFLAKIVGVPQKAGCAIIRSAVTLFVLMKSSTIPSWAKVSIIGALAYFISPIDVIPDFLPGGFIDDLAVMALLLDQLDVHIDTATLEEVEQQLPRYCRKKT